MIGWGILLIILGAGSLLLPQLGFQFQLMSLLDDFQPWAGIVVAVIGVALVVLAMNRRSEAVPAAREPWQPQQGQAAAPTSDEEQRPR